MDPLSLLWLFFILASLQPAAQRYLLEARRRSKLASLSRKRGATVITLIHRQETMSFFGFPVVRFIDIDDAEGVLRAIRATPPGHPIELILHSTFGTIAAYWAQPRGGRHAPGDALPRIASRRRYAVRSKTWRTDDAPAPQQTPG